MCRFRFDLFNRCGAQMASGLTPEQRRRQRQRERAIVAAMFVAAASSVFVALGIIGTLLYESASFFRQVPLTKFLTDTVWTPLFDNPRYGILPLLAGTLLSTIVALAVAIPLGLTVAVYLSEFAHPRLREWVKPALEMLSGVPTVVYGFFALLFVTPLLQNTMLPRLPGFNILSAGIVIGIMILPYIASLSEDAMRAVPQALRDGSLALGATKFETAVRVVLPGAFSGIAAAFVLALSRAVGETMIVAIAAGQQPNLTLDPREPAATITAFIVQVALGDLPHGSIGYQSIFAAGLVLFVMTLAFNMLAFWLRRRYREAY
jgi:phosphate transport system permease protein